MLNPQSTIQVSDWMLQSVQNNKTRQRSQALTQKGNEHAHAYWGERTTESAEFTLGGTYTGNITLPALGGGITDYTLVYSETEFPTLSVSKDTAAGGGIFTFPEGITFPARTIGCPAAIPGIYKDLNGAKKVTIAVTCQHVEEPDGNGAYGTLNGMHDVTVTVTIEGVGGKPTVTFEDGWTSPSETDGNSNSALGTGSVVYVRHFAIGDDPDAE